MCYKNCQQTNAESRPRENRSRRNNLIIYGAKKTIDDDWQSLEQVDFKKIFQDVLNISRVPFEHIQRIGKPPNKCRPPLIKLLNGPHKAKIFKNCKKLRESALSTSEDFSHGAQQIQKSFGKVQNSTKIKATRIYFFFDKIRITGKQFHWDEERHNRLCSCAQTCRLCAMTKFLWS